MCRSLAVLLAVLGAGFACSQPVSAQQAGACSLLPKEEVKKHLPWIDFLDSMPIEEEPIGSSGSSCNYPSVFIQVLPFSQGLMDAVRTQDDTEAVSGGWITTWANKSTHDAPRNAINYARIDRDGVLNHDSGYTFEAGKLQWIEGAREAVKAVNDAPDAKDDEYATDDYEVVFSAPTCIGDTEIEFQVRT